MVKKAIDDSSRSNERDKENRRQLGNGNDDYFMRCKTNWRRGRVHLIVPSKPKARRGVIIKD